MNSKIRGAQLAAKQFGADFIMDQFIFAQCQKCKFDKGIFTKVIYELITFSFVIILLLFTSACSSKNNTELIGTEHLECTPGVQFVNHSVTCEVDSQNWPECQVSGVVENISSGEAKGVMVWVQFGPIIDGERSSTFNTIGDLKPGQKTEFKNEFFHYEPLTQYDIKIECNEFESANPTQTPTPKNSFINYGPKDDIFTLAIDHSNPDTMYVGTQTQGVFKSIDGGLSWAQNNSGLVNMKIGTLAIDPHLSTTIYAGTYGTDGTNGAAYKSKDSGENWVNISNGLGGAYVLSLAIDPLYSSNIYAGTSDGIFKSTNGGERWQALNTGIPDPYILHLVTDSLSPSNVYAISFGNSEHNIIKSTNGGDDWFDINTDFTNIVELVIDPQMPNTLYAGTDSQGIFKSTDAGKNWIAINTGLGDHPRVMGLIVDPKTPSTLYTAIRDSDIFISTNGGESWSKFDTNLGDIFIWTLEINPVKPTIIYAASEMGVFVLGE